ncbi:lymphocyte antigen 75-like [Antedon mediterranea]|uniref:lymphocyte antigen 75-like n=1 Tax=Antedon mediterranea TaxID=105859 RepID=UPI003AF86A74
MNYSTQYSFAVKVVTEIDEQLVIGESSPTTNHEIYPPSLLRPPSLLSRGSLGVNITWDEWTYAFDKGIGNVTAYIVEWWDAVSATDVSTIRYTGDPSEGILIPNITYDTNVVVRIATVYINGESEKNGIPSPVLVVLKDNICPYDWKQFEDTCYLLDDSLLNWNDASSFCQEQSAHLVSIISQSESDFVVLAVQGKAYDHWIGLSFQSSSMNWYWSTGEILAYQNWQGTLDASSGACAQIDSDSGFWSNMPCQSITGNRAICKKGVQKFGCLDETWHGYKDECYKYLNNRTTRQEAAQSCRNFRTAELTSIHSLNEDEFVQTIIRSYSEDTWIGLKYRNNEVTGLQWTDETDVEYLINGINQTNIDSKCAAYSQDDHIFSWKFMDCSTENAYVCKDIRGNKHLTNLAF